MEISTLFPSDPDKISEKDHLQLHPFSIYNSSTARSREVRAIVAMARENAIGRNGKLPWHLPEDLKHFKELTMGHPIIMGRKTWESLPRRPLPGRRNMVVSRNPDYHAEGAEVFGSVEEAIDACREVPFIIGGAEIYRTSLPFCTKIFVTFVDTEIPDADAFFPDLSLYDWKTIDSSDQMVSASGAGYSFKTFVRL